MPILALDQFGNIIQTDRDRSDGKGFSGAATAVTRRDNTLDNSYLVSERALEAEIALNKVGDAVVDAFDERASRARKALKARKAQALAGSEETVNSQGYRELMTKRALSTTDQHCQCRSGVSGHGLSSNGLSGLAGMSNDERAIHNHLNGLGAAPSAVGVDEQEQYQLQQQAQVDAYFRAQKEALRVTAEAKAGKLNKARRAPVNVRPVHPLLAMFASKGFK